MAGSLGRLADSGAVRETHSDSSDHAARLGTAGEARRRPPEICCDKKVIGRPAWRPGTHHEWRSYEEQGVIFL
jgi:hypothetical protein